MRVDTPPLPSVREAELARLGLSYSFLTRYDGARPAVDVVVSKPQEFGAQYVLTQEDFVEWMAGHDVDGHVVSYSMPGSVEDRDKVFTWMRVIGIRCDLAEAEQRQAQNALNMIRMTIEQSLRGLVGRRLIPEVPTRSIRVEQDPRDPSRVNVDINVPASTPFIRMALEEAIECMDEDVKPKVTKVPELIEPRFQPRRIIDVD